MKQYNVAVVGATGWSGRKFRRCSKSASFPLRTTICSLPSAARALPCPLWADLHRAELTETCMDGLDVDIALFSAGAGTSLQFAPIVARLMARW